MREDIAVRHRITGECHLTMDLVTLLDTLPAGEACTPLLVDLAARCEAVGYFEPAVLVYDRCLHTGLEDDERQVMYARLSAACHAAAVVATDDDVRRRHVHDGLYAATAALDPNGAQQPQAMCTALAHRAVLLAQIGHHEAALIDARQARVLALREGMQREQVIAAVGEVIARWNSTLDTTVLLLISEIHALGDDLDIDELIRPATQIEVDVLWTLDRHDEARAALQRSNERLHDLLLQRRDDAVDDLHAAIDALRAAVEIDTDPLTGLPTTAHLDTWLPEVLADDAVVCVAALDVDGFAAVNRDYGTELADGVLQELAGLLERVCRRGDAVTRAGGDEFVIVLRGASPNDARVVLERIRQLIATRSFVGLPADFHLSVSIGATVGSGAENAELLQMVAMEAMRQAKASGGDRVSVR
jgi:diguanylate cyclase (GGDEF)-like protein